LADVALRRGRRRELDCKEGWLGGVLLGGKSGVWGGGSGRWTRFCHEIMWVRPGGDVRVAEDRGDE